MNGKMKEKRVECKTVSYILVYVMESINSLIFITQIPGPGFCSQQILIEPLLCTRT